jgi:hypothetical protein
VNTFDPWTALFVFLIYCALDVVYVKYTIAVISKNPLASAIYAGLTNVCIVLGVLSYVNNKAYAIPLIAGSFVGTYLAVKFGGK